MALQYNQVTLSGRLTTKPELKSTSGEKFYTSFTIAVQRNGVKDVTDFIPCVAWKKTAEFITKYFDKGSSIFVTGALQSRKYENKEGKNVTAYEVIISTANFVENKSESAPVETYAEVSQDNLPF